MQIFFVEICNQQINLKIKFSLFLSNLVDLCYAARF